MAFNATNPLLADAYKRIREIAFQVKNYSQSRSALFTDGATESEILATVDNLTSMRNSMQSLAATPGLSEYAKIQEDDPGYNVIAEYTAMIASINSVLDYITANILAPRKFTSVQLVSLKADLDAIVTAIN